VTDEINEAFTVPPDVVYSPMVLVGDSFTTKRSIADAAMLPGLLNPEISDAFTVAPEVVYSPIVPAPRLETKMLSALAGLLKSSPSRTANRPPDQRVRNGSIVVSSKNPNLH